MSLCFNCVHCTCTGLCGCTLGKAVSLEEVLSGNQEHVARVSMSALLSSLNNLYCGVMHTCMYMYMYSVATTCIYMCV